VRALSLLALLGCSAHRYSDGSGLEAQLEREIIALKQRLRSVEEDLSHCGTQAEGSLYASLHQVFAGSAIDVVQRGPATVLSVRMSHLFSDLWEMTQRQEADRHLDLLATAVLLNPDHDVTVIGHTDDRAIPRAHSDRYADALQLSLQLASHVATELAESYEIDETRFTVAGRGSRDPLESNDLPAGQDANARLELILQRRPPPDPG